MRPLAATAALVVSCALCAFPATADPPANGSPAQSDAGTSPRANARPAHFMTSFTPGPRASNIELAASAIDGKTIAAGATFSFNDAVGERTAAFGYARAVVLRDGMIAEGSGGGACQVASTLHAAALLAGLEIVARAPHSRPSAYIRMGLDATVAYPSIDLKIKNPFATVLTIHARASKDTLDVSIDGTEPPKVTITSEILERIPFERVIERDRTLGDDAAHVKSFGIPGYRVRRTREVTIGEVTRRDTRTDLYPPTNETIRARTAETEGRVIEAGATPPVLVQTRPSERVVLSTDADR